MFSSCVMLRIKSIVNIVAGVLTRLINCLLSGVHEGFINHNNIYFRFQLNFEQYLQIIFKD